MTAVGFIGLGTMGKPMAAHLQTGGYPLVVNTRGKVPDTLTTGGAIVCGTGREVATRTDIIFLMVPDTPDVEAVLFGSAGVAEGLRPGTIVVDMSSISPTATKTFAKRINDLQCEYLDAPVSGGEVGAKAATLTIMVGGREETFLRVKPLFEHEVARRLGDADICARQRMAGIPQPGVTRHVTRQASISTVDREQVT